MIPLANALVSEVGINNFKYAILKPAEEFRVNMGFNAEDEDQPWAIKVYENEENIIEFEKWFDEADVVLFSNRTFFAKASQRVKKNKLTFYFSERWWKPKIGRWRLLFPKHIKFVLEIRKLSKNPNFHYLAQGGHAANDIQFITKFKDRIWNFGYFTAVTETTFMSSPTDTISVLWCGRMLQWKRVDVLIKAFSEVIKKHPHCHLTLVGDGEEKEKLEILAKEILPLEMYSIIPSQKIEVIREMMGISDIYVLPSSGYEGWGAVVNEAMSEACAVIASVNSGAGKAIIEDGVNGFLFKSGDCKALSKILHQLIVDEKLRTQIQFNGQKCIKEIWSPQEAAKRFVKICDIILNRKEKIKFDSGPFNKNFK